MSNISISGIGWLSPEGYGSVRLGWSCQFLPGEGVHSLAKLGLFAQPFKNYGRLDKMTRMTVSAVALALQDAGIEYSSAAKQDIGIIGASSEGSLQSDIDYFRDFVDNGRTLSRANLFIYTLPSSASGEAAIHFGLTGPLFYTSGTEKSCGDFLGMAAGMVESRDAGRMLTGVIAGDTALWFVIEESHVKDLCTLPEAQSIMQSTENIADILRHFLTLNIKRGTVCG